MLASLERWLTQRLRLRMKREKSGVARPWSRKFLGYSVTWNRTVRLSRGRGRRLTAIVQELNLATRGWVVYFRLAEVKASFEALDQWLRRKLR